MKRQFLVAALLATPLAFAFACAANAAPTARDGAAVTLEQHVLAMPQPWRFTSGKDFALTRAISPFQTVSTPKSWSAKGILNPYSPSKLGV
jgi:hypothetical protein